MQGALILITGVEFIMISVLQKKPTLYFWLKDFLNLALVLMFTENYLNKANLEDTYYYDEHKIFFMSKFTLIYY